MRGYRQPAMSVLDVAYSKECVKQKKRQRARTKERKEENVLPIVKGPQFA